MSNQIKPQENKAKFTTMLQTTGYKNLINNTLQDPNRARRFIASISSAVAVNPMLQECDAGTILAGALLGESLNLSPSPQLGQYYLVPFNDSKKGKVAQFILGYKGMYALAVRSGQYKNINSVAVKQGEFQGFNPFTNKISCTPILDPTKRSITPTVGYYASFEMLNGFERAVYIDKEEMILHADKYSPAFSLAAKNGKVSYKDFEDGKVANNELWKYSSFWYKNFDMMGIKTGYRRLLSLGDMSTEMIMAFENDEKILIPNADSDGFETLNLEPDNQAEEQHEQQPIQIETPEIKNVSMEDL